MYQRNSGQDRMFKYPDATWCRQQKRYNPYTPDLPALEQRERHWVFICCDLKLRLPRDYMIEREPDVSSAFTEKSFVMWKKKLGNQSYPIPLENTFDDPFGQHPPLRIQGELYLLTPSQIILLDNLRLNGVEFERKRVKIIVPFRKGRLYKTFTKRVEAWMYIGRSSYWDELIDGGYMFNIVKIFEPPHQRRFYTQRSKTVYKFPLRDRLRMMHKAKSEPPQKWWERLIYGKRKDSFYSKEFELTPFTYSEKRAFVQPYYSFTRMEYDDQ